MIVKLIAISTMIWCIYKFIQKYIKLKKDESDETVKTIYDIFLIASSVPLLLYLMDKHNIPTQLGMVNNINSQNWLSFLGTYVSGMMTTLISVAFLIFVTREQLIKTFEDNKALNKENFKVQNLPFLKYALTHEPVIESQIMILKSKNKDSMPLEFNFEIKNIGLNATKKTFFEVKGKGLKRSYRSELTGVSCIEKNESKYITFYIDSLKNGEAELEINVFYQDLFKNWYEQKVKIILEASDIHEGSNRLYNKNVKVYDEKTIDVIPNWIENKTK